MSKELQVNSTVMDLAEFRKLLGSPPVLSTESADAYEMMVSGFMRSLVPRDFVEQSLITQLNDAMWDIQRYQRAKSMSIDRRHREHLEHKKKAEQALAERKASMAGEQAEAATATADLDRLYMLEGVFDASVSEVRRVAGQRSEDLDYSRAFEAGLESVERIDHLLHAAYARRRETLELLEIYRNGLGRDAPGTAPGIIEGEFKETITPINDKEAPLVPKVEAQNNDLEKKG